VAVVAALVSVAAFMAPAGAAAKKPAVDPNGVIRIAAGLSTALGGVNLDPTHSVVITDELWESLIYGSLVRVTPTGAIEPWMAKSFKIVDPQTLQLVLRPNVKFTDGTTYDAQAVHDGLLRTLNKPFATAVVTGHTAFFTTLTDVTVDNPLQVTLHLNQPVAGQFLYALAGREGSIVSPKAAADSAINLNKNPVGAGPFIVTEFRTDLLSLRRNPNFWDAQSWKLGGVDFVDSPAGTQSLNGLLAGTLDMTTVLNTDVPSVQGRAGYGLIKNQLEYGDEHIDLCTTKPPLDNVDVRRAISMGIDRAQIVNVAFGGLGSPSFGLWPTTSTNFNPQLKTLNAYNPKQAKKLLQQSGVTLPLNVDLYWVTGRDQRLPELIQAQLAKIGINVNLISSRNVVTDFQQPNKPGMLEVPGSRAGLDKYAKLFVPGNQQVACGATFDVMQPLIQKVGPLNPNDPQLAKTYQQLDATWAKNGWLIPLVFAPTYTAFNSNKVAGVKGVPTKAPMYLQDAYVLKG
jgi:ABC-type transport system substrate-binding protein